MKLPRLLGALLVAANLPAFAAALPAPATSDPDLELTLEAKLALFGGLGREALPIDVDSSSGLVTLHGDVCTSASREKAQTMVAALAGVTGVVDLLTVSRDEDAADLGLVRDDALAADVSEALLAEAVPFSGVTVTSVKQGSVALEGGVRCLSDAVAVLRAALRVPGVHAVQSRVRIAGPDGLAQDELVSACASRRGLSSGLRDAWLVRDVKQRLASAAGVSPAVRVDSVDGIVTLFGVVGSEEERQAASAAARAVPGVREVREALSVQSVA
ncbi:MAG TPA: BON domain-containing protein, partial [Planctomycetota bacterium]|nr:BON domain-containing protein [Planctomycetota bacterium]